MPTKEQLFQQKADIEQQIKEFVEQLTTLSDEAKENTQNEIIKLEHQREEIIQQLIGKIKEELSTVSQEVEKKPLQDQLEKYEREVWENQSYYTGVIALIEQDNSAAGRTLLDVIKEKPLSITPEQVETAAERITISTYELLKGSMTAEKLKIALSHSSLDQRFKTLGVGTDPEKRLEKTLERAHEVAKQFVEWKIFDNEAEKAQNAELLNYCHNVIAPWIEWYVLELLQGREGEDNHANNQEILSFLQNFNVSSIKGAFNSAVGLAQGASKAYVAIKSMTRALDYLSIQRQKDKNFLHKIKTAEMLRNPAHFREFLLLGAWQNKDPQGEDSNLYTIGREQLGIPFENEEKAFWLTATDRQEVLVRIGTIDVQPTPETSSRILDIMEKSPAILKSLQKGKDQLLTTGDVLTKSIFNPLKQLLGIDVMKNIENNKFLKGILNFILSIFGFPGGFEGRKRRRFLKPIEEDFGDETESKARKEQIAVLYETYQDLLSHKTPEELKPEDTLFEIYKKKGVKFLQNSETFFNIDQPTLQTTLKDKLDTATLNPLAVKAVLGGNYVKTVDKKLVVHTDKINQNKDLFLEHYLKIITQHLAGNPKFLSSVDSTDTVVFTIISSLFVQEGHVINGIEANVFLPTDFVNTPPPAITSSGAETTTNLEPLKGYDGKLMYFDQIPGTDGEKQAFKAKVEEISTFLEINPNWLMAVMKHESGFSHQAVNAATNATGLIQFMPATAQGLGTSVEALKEMTAVQQLDYVKNYYQQRKGQFMGFEDLRLFAFFPAALGHTNNPDYIFETDTLPASIIAQQNPTIAPGKNQITMADYRKRVAQTVTTLPPDFHRQFVSSHQVA